LYNLDLPSWEPLPSTLPGAIRQSLNIRPSETYKTLDYLLVFNTEEEVRKININRHFFDQINLGAGGVIVTAPEKKVILFPAFLHPKASILEDAVTGSAHCCSTPFWAKWLNKREFLGIQLSERQGTLYCTYHGGRVTISSQTIEQFGLNKRFASKIHDEYIRF